MRKNVFQWLNSKQSAKVAIFTILTKSTPASRTLKISSSPINAYTLHLCQLPFATKKNAPPITVNLATRLGQSLQPCALPPRIIYRSNKLSSSSYQFLPSLPLQRKNLLPMLRTHFSLLTAFNCSLTLPLFYNLYSSLAAIAFVSSTNSATPSSSGRCAANGSPSPTAGKADRKLLRSVLRR